MHIDDSNQREQGDLIRTAFGKVLAAQRATVGYSQRTFARLVRISNSHLRKIELGQTSPTLVTLYRIADALQVDPGVLLSKTNELISSETNPRKG